MNWIPVSERLPEEGEWVFVWVSFATKGRQFKGQWNDIHGCPWGPNEVTHWCRIVTPGASSPCERCARLREALSELTTMAKKLGEEWWLTTDSIPFGFSVALGKAQAALKEIDNA